MLTKTIQTAGPRRRPVWPRIYKNYMLYLFVLPAITYAIIFNYIPMYGIQIAFKNFRPVLGIAGSPWTGLRHFERFIFGPQFWRLIRNTLTLSLYGLVAGFPMPIILALLINQLRQRRYKRYVQMVTYAPHFLSTVVLVGMVLVFLSPRSGFVNGIIRLLGGNGVFFMAKAGLFPHIYVWSGIWQNAGWGTIIYLAALAGVNPELHEAAIIDGASKPQRIRYIDIPAITPTAVILLILNVGRIMSVGFEKAFLMQNPLILETAEIISTYVYKVGLIGAEFSFGAAVGLFNNAINLVLLLSVNSAARRLSGTGLW